jgi:integrase
MMAGFAITTLTGWWKDKTLADVRGATCRGFAKFRREQGRKDATSRRELAILQAAINHWHREHGPLESVPVVTLPPKPRAREHWLSRKDAALLLAGALGWYRRQWSDVVTRTVRWQWERHKPSINRPLARFIVIGLHTGTRHAAILSLQWMANITGGWVDFERGVMHRRGEGAVESKKRQPPVRLGKRLLSHMRRWKKIDENARYEVMRGTNEPVHCYFHLVASQTGGALQKMRKPWYEAREFAGLGRHVTPHILRHTRATWLVQSGIDYWEAAGTLGMSVQMLEDVYGHHHPDFQKKAAEV